MSLCSTRERFQKGMPLRPLGLSVETMQKMGEILIFAAINGRISQFVCNG